MTLNVVNLLATSRFAEYLDLDHFSIEADVDFDPDRFPGLTYKIASPKVCALMFRSGRIVITGAKNLNDVEQALEITHKALRENGCEVWADYDYVIGNVVVTHDLERELNLALIGPPYQDIYSLVGFAHSSLSLLFLASLLGSNWPSS